MAARTNKQSLTWVSFVNYTSKLHSCLDTCFKEQLFFFYQSILCQQTESARWWLPPWPASDFSKCAIVQSELCFIDLFHGRRKITSGLLPVRNNNGVLFCCLYFLGQTSVVKIFYHSCVERVGGFSVEMVLRIGFWSAHQEIIQPFSDSFVALVHWGEIRWFTWIVKVKKKFVRLWKKNPGNVSPTVQKEHFLCVLFCLKELSGFMEILFFPESACWPFFFLLLSCDGSHFHGW